MIAPAISLALATALSWQAPPASQPQRSRVVPVLGFPPPISERNRGWMYQVLALSDAQRAVADTMFDEYRQDDTALRAGPLEAIRTRGAEVVSNGQPVGEWRDLMKQRDALVVKMDALDRSLFDKLGSILSDSQAFGMDRVRLARDRWITSSVPSSSPGVTIDLTTLVADVEAHGLAVITDQVAFDEECSLYEQEVTPLMRLRFEALLRLWREDNGLFADMASHAVGSPPFQDARRHQDALYRQLQRAERRVHDVNVGYVERLSALLNVEGASVFRGLFRVQAYPNIYPNPFNPEPAAIQVITCLPVGEQLAAVEAGLRTWRDSDQRIGEEMVATQLKWMERLSRNRATNQPAYDDYEQKMTQLQAERREICDALVRQIRDNSTTSLDKAVRKALAELDRAIAEHKSRRNGTIYFP